MNPVVHFEMPYDDPSRMGKFYKAAFGWKTEMLGGKMGNYVLATTTESAPDGTPRKPARINGGFYPKKPDWPEQHPSVVIAVGDMRKAMAKVASAGGRVLGEPMDIPGIGAYVSFMDTEGNRVSMLEPLPMVKEKKPAAKKAKAKRKSRR
jgi:predicted enzyme related to lactoylglutathione lyase